MHPNEINCRHVCLSMSKDPEHDKDIVLCSNCGKNSCPLNRSVSSQCSLTTRSVWLDGTSEIRIDTVVWIMDVHDILEIFLKPTADEDRCYDIN
jgi:flavoprotein